jgi:hypothetical protein
MFNLENGDRALEIPDAASQSIAEIEDKPDDRVDFVNTITRLDY